MLAKNITARSCCAGVEREHEVHTRCGADLKIQDACRDRAMRDPRCVAKHRGTYCHRRGSQMDLGGLACRPGVWDLAEVISHSRYRDLFS